MAAKWAKALLWAWDSPAQLSLAQPSPPPSLADSAMSMACVEHEN